MDREPEAGPPPDPLKLRLSYLQAALRKRAEGEGGQPADQVQAEEAPGDRIGGSAPALFEVQGWEKVGEFMYRRRLSSANPLEKEELSPLLVPPGCSPEDLVFFDTETTGLSGGAGNLIFLIGFGRINGPQLEVEQVFLADFPGEREFLERIRPELGAGRLLVSYNGRAFDAHILQNRFLLNRLPFQLERQSDLLHWARRLWKRVLTDCSLSSIEREILGVRRFQDVAGFEVPGIYLEYLRHGWSSRLPLVWEHNLQDVRTLARLFAEVNLSLTERKTPARTDLTSLGSILLGHGLPRGLELLERSFACGDQTAGRTLSLHYKRSGSWEQAARVWMEMLERGNSLFAAVELAKYCEHRRQDAREALAWVRRVLSWSLPLDTFTRRELSRRLARLERKTAGRR